VQCEIENIYGGYKWLIPAKSIARSTRGMCLTLPPAKKSDGRPITKIHLSDL
jgi:hypothetical protein